MSVTSCHLRPDGAPQVASRLTGAFALHKRYDETRGALMRAQLERIKALPGLSKDTYEVCSRSLA